MTLYRIIKYIYQEWKDYRRISREIKEKGAVAYFDNHR